MIKVKYNDSPDTFVECEFSRISEHVVYLKGGLKNTSGFLTYRHKTEDYLGNLSDYKTIYKVLSDGVLYSDDYSVYVKKTPLDNSDILNKLDTYPNKWDIIEAQVAYTSLVTNTKLDSLEITKEMIKKWCEHHLWNEVNARAAIDKEIITENEFEEFFSQKEIIEEDNENGNIE